MSLLTRSTAGMIRSVRRFSSISVEETKALAERLEKHRKFKASTAYPTTMTTAMGSGVELHKLKDKKEAAVLSGMPSEHAARTMTIKPRMSKTLQSGDRYANQWQLSWKTSGKFYNPLMGWGGSADPLSTTKLTFDSAQDAIAFAEKNGWKYEVSNPVSHQTVEPGTYNYSHNFLPKKTLQILKEKGHKQKIFAAPGYGSSNWFMMPKYHGDGICEQHGERVKK